MDFVGRGEGRGLLLEHLVGLSAQWLGCLPWGATESQAGRLVTPRSLQHELKGQEGSELRGSPSSDRGQDRATAQTTDGCHCC